MALSEAQEQILQEIIEAFQNGKRLSELPEVGDTNPYNLMVEVLEKGESKRATLASLLPYMEDECSYGVEFDTTVSTPTCTRIGNMNLHKTLPVQSLMKGCTLGDDGQVVDYLPVNDWTGAVRDGSRGQVMVELPLYYRKFETEGTKRRVRISLLPLPGYHQVPRKYVSAYEATLDRTGMKLASVVNMAAQYRGGNNNEAYDGTCRTFLGRPVTQTSRTNFRKYARARGAVGKNGCGWNCMTYDIQKDIYWLFVVEFATLNTQAGYNAQLTAEGYRQGGLGEGVTSVGSAIGSDKEHHGETTESWAVFNGNYPWVPCGTTDALGNGTGQVEYSQQDTDTGAWLDQFVPRYRGIENPFGHIWQWTDGINVRINPAATNGGNDKSEVFVCEDPAQFTDSGYDGYSLVGLEARNESYVKEVIFGEGGEIMPAVCSGAGSTTYHCDYHYTNIPTTTTLRGVRFGGFSYGGAAAGLVCASSAYAPSNASSTVGSRLCFLP